MVCDEWGTSCEELAMPRSLLFAWHFPLFGPHSLLFAPFELGGMRREEPFGKLAGGGMALEELFAPLDVELAAFFLLFGWLEGQGMRCEEEGMRLEARGT
jgi:hypothetical protein